MKTSNQPSSCSAPSTATGPARRPASGDPSGHPVHGRLTAGIVSRTFVSTIQRAVQLVCLAVLLTAVARADGLPFFSTLREEVVNQLTIATNTPPLNKKLVAALRTNLKLIDRTKPTLVNGSAALGVLAKGLARTAPSNTFLPILTDTRTVYVEALNAEIPPLVSRLGATIPGKAQNAAWTALAKLSAAIDDARTNVNFTVALKSLSKAAKALVVAQKAVGKAETARPGASFVTATITESNQGVTSFKAAGGYLDGAYYPDDGVLNLFAGDLKKLGGGLTQARLITLIATVPASGSYTFNLAGSQQSFATYDRGIYRNINSDEPDVEFEDNFSTANSFSTPPPAGTLNISVDLEARLAWGDFTFTASGSNDSNLAVSMTGSFLIRLEVIEDDFEEFE
jgi:hypothetical protein